MNALTLLSLIGRQLVASLTVLFVFALAPCAAYAGAPDPLGLKAVNNSGATSLVWNANAGGDRYDVRTRPLERDWSPWTNSAVGSISVPGVQIGEKLAIRVRDAASGNELWSGRLVVISNPVCSIEAVQPRTAEPILVPKQDPVDLAASMTFSGGETVSALQTAASSGLAVQSLQTSVEMPSGGIYTVGLDADADSSFDENLRFFQDFVAKDAKQFKGEVSDSESALGEAYAEPTATSNRLEAVASSYESSGTATVNQIAVSGSQEEVAIYVAKFEGNISSSTSIAPSTDCEEAVVDQRTIESSVSASAFTERLGGSINYRNFTPRSIGVKTFNQVFRRIDGSRQQVRKAVLQFSWCPNCMKFWSDRAYDPNYNELGVEVQLDLNQDGGGGLWGRVPWVLPESRPEDVPPENYDPNSDIPATSAGISAAGVPRAWSANFPCAYADDYTSDQADEKSLTIGSACPPGSWDGGQGWRWAQVLLNDSDAYDDNDGVRPSVQAVRRPVTTAEAGYCLGQNQRVGSCMFGVGFETPDDTTDDVSLGDGYFRGEPSSPTMLVTPGADRFLRRDLAADISEWRTSPIRQCVDSDTYIAHSLAAKDLTTLSESLRNNLGAFESLLPYDYELYQAFGGTLSQLASVIQPHVGLNGFTLNPHTEIEYDKPGYGNATITPVVITSKYVWYQIRAISDLGATIVLNITSEQNSIGPDVWRYVWGEATHAPSGDSHEGEYNITASLQSRTCVPSGQEPDPT